MYLTDLIGFTSFFPRLVMFRGGGARGSGFKKTLETGFLVTFVAGSESLVLNILVVDIWYREKGGSLCFVQGTLTLEHMNWYMLYFGA